MVLYYAILRGWLGLDHLAGVAPTEVVLRLPSAMFAVAASAVIFLLGPSSATPRSSAGSRPPTISPPIPVGVSTDRIAEADRLKATIGRDHLLVAQVTGHGSSADTSAYLFAARP